MAHVRCQVVWGGPGELEDAVNASAEEGHEVQQVVSLSGLRQGWLVIWRERGRSSERAWQAFEAEARAALAEAEPEERIDVTVPEPSGVLATVRRWVGV